MMKNIGDQIGNVYSRFDLISVGQHYMVLRGTKLLPLLLLLVVLSCAAKAAARTVLYSRAELYRATGILLIFAKLVSIFSMFGKL